MKRTLIVGTLLFVSFAVAFAPATLLRQLLPADGNVEMLGPAGTLWNGSANVFLDGTPLDRIVWRFRPAALLQAALGYHLTLIGPEHDMAGTLQLGIRHATVELNGRAAAGFVNRWLGPYDIAVTGDFAVDGINLSIPYNLREGRPGAAAGSVAWTGGPLQYQLAGQLYSSQLPPLVAYLGDALEAVVYQQGGHTPLLRAEVQANGFVRIGMTALMTRLVDNPWPGSHAEHEVVLEVEELVF
ncbi:MAG: type II secretion system protein N [Pseudomonadales bacterium]